jgi:FkbM family methyltransferase
VTQLSHSIAAERRPRGLWRRLRRLFASIDLLDVDEIRDLIAKFEANQRNIQESQRRLATLFRAHAAVPFTPPLISPLEFATGDRYELENRCRAMTNPVYLGENTALCRVLGGYKIYLDTRDTGFGSHVLLDGYWEPWITVFVARQLRPGMTVIDVGANYGYYTLLFGALVGPTGHVYAVEPNPAVVPNLRRSVDLNGLTSRTTIVPAAAGAVEGGEASLFAPRGEPKNATVTMVPETAAPESGVFYTVPQVTADSFAAAATRIDFVKIDAEGAEEGVIAGMMKILIRDKPGLILEFNAARYHDPCNFIDKLKVVYSQMRYIDYESNASPVTTDDLLTKNWGQDWLLYFDQPVGQIAK